MSPKLIRELTKISSEVIDAETTLSKYFTIGCIKVRISDHYSSNNNCDLFLFRSGKGYTAMPNLGTFREVKYFTNVTSLIDYIIQYEYFAMIFCKNITTLPVHVEHFQQVVIKKEEERKTIDKKIRYLYDQKKPDLKPLLIELQQIVPEAQKDVIYDNLHKKASQVSGKSRLKILKETLSTVKQQFQ